MFLDLCLIWSMSTFQVFWANTHTYIYVVLFWIKLLEISLRKYVSFFLRCVKMSNVMALYFVQMKLKIFWPSRVSVNLPPFSPWCGLWPCQGWTAWALHRPDQGKPLGWDWIGFSPSFHSSEKKKFYRLIDWK